MATNTKMRAVGGIWSLNGSRVTAAFLTALALNTFTWAANADTWTGAGQRQRRRYISKFAIGPM